MIILCPNNMSKCEVEIPENSKDVRIYSLGPEIHSEAEINKELLNQIRKKAVNFTNYFPVVCIYCGHFFLVLYDEISETK